MLGFYVRFPTLDNLTNMIITIGRNFGWASPNVIDKMFVDADDWEGIEYWYKDVQLQHSEIEKKNAKPKK